MNNSNYIKTYKNSENHSNRSGVGKKIKRHSNHQARQHTRNQLRALCV